MAKKMLIDATHAEETRVAVVDGHRLVDFDYESIVRKQLKGSIFLAKVTRVEPSLQAAFVNFGGNRHGFLPFAEIHPDYYRIPVADREALLAEQRAAIEAEEAAEAEEEARMAARREAAARAQEGLDPGDASDLGESEGDEGEGEISYTPEEVGGVSYAVAGDQDSEHADSEGAGEGFADEAGLEPAAHSGNTGTDVFSGSEEDETRAEAGFRDEEPDAAAGAFDASGAFQDEDREGLSEGDVLTDADVVEAGDAGESGALGEEGAQEDRSGDEAGAGGGGRRRGGRFRRDGGRRGRGGMAHRARRAELVGGEEIEGETDRPVRSFQSRRQYKIQEVIKRGQIMLIQVSKEERGNKGAAVTTYLSLPGRYCVLMPNSPRGGGVSRKIANYEDRQRMKEILHELNVPEGMSVIVRTAGVSRSKIEIKRDLDYLLKLWDTIRDLTLKSSAPALIYEEANLVKRAVRDLYGPEIDEVWVSGAEAYRASRDFMKILMPSHARKIHEYNDERIPLFHRYQIENQIAAIGEPQVTLRSGGYLVINPTEALVSIDVNSGRATKERHIEETALKTNLEAADEVARQLRLRDLGGLVVIDFIDMEDRRNNARVERRLKEALSSDRARIQVGRISSFGLMELSRQRLNPSLTETQFQQCPHCNGVGRVRTLDSAAILVMRAIEEEGIAGRASEIALHVSGAVALYILNHKRVMLATLERRYGFKIFIAADETQGAAGYRIEVLRPVSREDGPALRGGDQDEDSRSGRGGDGDESRPVSGPVTAPSYGADADEAGEEDGDAMSDEGGEAESAEVSPRNTRGRGPRGDRGASQERGGDRAGAAGDRGDRGGERGASQQDRGGDRTGDRGDRGDRGGRRRGRRGGRGRSRGGREGGAGFSPRDPNTMLAGGEDIPDDIGNRRDPSDPAFGGADFSPAGEAEFSPLPSDVDGNRVNARDSSARGASSRGITVRHHGRRGPRTEASAEDGQGRAARAPESSAPSAGSSEGGNSPSFERVNEAPSQKKRGWWNRLVE